MGQGDQALLELSYLGKYITRMAQSSELRNDWACLKTQRTMSMTVDAWNLLGDLSDTADLSRSEVLEVLIRFSMDMGIDPAEIKTELLRKVAVPT